MQELEHYKIIKEEERTVYGSAVLPGNTALFLLRVEQMTRYDMAGQLFNLYMPEPERFGSMAEVIHKMDTFMDEVNYPQAAVKLRDIHFDGGRMRRGQYDRLAMDKLPWIIQYWHPTLFSHPVDRYAAVFIRVMYRQHSSWQGTVLWRGRDGLRQQLHFRSVLELMNILQSAIASTDYAALERKGIIHDESST